MLNVLCPLERACLIRFLGLSVILSVVVRHPKTGFRKIVKHYDKEVCKYLCEALQARDCWFQNFLQQWWNQAQTLLLPLLHKLLFPLSRCKTNYVWKRYKLCKNQIHLRSKNLNKVAMGNRCVKLYTLQRWCVLSIMIHILQEVM